MEELLQHIKTGNIDGIKQALNDDKSIADAITPHGVSVLQFAAYCQNTEAVQLIKNYKTSIDVFEAAAIGEQQVVKEAIVDNPALKTAYSVDGFSLLGLAAFFGHLDLAEFLLIHGFNPNISSNNDFKVAPLHSACATSNIEMAKLLLQNEAKVNAKQMNDVTPLHSAAHNGSMEMVKLLVSNHADQNAKTTDGKTAYDMAVEGSFEEISKLLTQTEGNSKP